MPTETVPAPDVPTGAPSPAVNQPRHGSRQHRRFSEARIVFAVSALCYLAAAWWFWHRHLVPGDAVSRLSNAYYVLFSRDPHLAAVGFVWNPLPSLAMLPALPFKALVPALTRDGLLAPLFSALCMSGTVAVGNDVLRRLRLARTPRIALTLLLAVHPMMLIYAGNGMSEAIFLFFLILTVRGLFQWLSDGRAGSLVPVGLSLALAYGARYEALAPGVAVPTLVAAMSWWRARDRVSCRYATARADAILVGLPIAVAFAGWAVTSKLIVGQWFATFSSVYGNTAQVSASAAGIESVTGATLGERITYSLHQLLGLEPLVLVLMVLAGTVAVRRRDPRVFAPVAVFGSVLAFENLTFLSGNSFGWLRFQIAAVPLAVLLTGFLLTASGTRASRVELFIGHGNAPQTSIRIRRRTTVAAAALSVATALAVPAAVVTLTTPTLAREESEWFTDAGAARTAGLAHLHARIATELDAMALPQGSVITDSAYAFPIILASRHPRQFVITSDRDFPAALHDPSGHQVRYLLISATGAADAVRRAYPDAVHPDVGDRTVRTWDDEWGKILWTLTRVP
jgi:hypothetical protein